MAPHRSDAMESMPTQSERQWHRYVLCTNGCCAVEGRRVRPVPAVRQVSVVCCRMTGARSAAVRQVSLRCLCQRWAFTCTAARIERSTLRHVCAVRFAERLQTADLGCKCPWGRVRNDVRHMSPMRHRAWIGCRAAPHAQQHRRRRRQRARPAVRRMRKRRSADAVEPRCRCGAFGQFRLGRSRQRH